MPAGDTLRKLGITEAEFRELYDVAIKPPYTYIGQDVNTEKKWTFRRCPTFPEGCVGYAKTFATCMVYNTSNQWIPSNTQTYLQFNGSIQDDDGAFDLANNWYVFPRKGLYDINYWIVWGQQRYHELRIMLDVGGGFFNHLTDFQVTDSSAVATNKVTHSGIIESYTRNAGDKFALAAYGWGADNIYAVTRLTIKRRIL